MQYFMEQQQIKPTIFILMPFSHEFDNVFYAIREAASEIGAKVERADRPLTAEIISQRIYLGIENADLILADLTGRNPNVIYEVGYAHALGKPAAFLAPGIQDIPFDLRIYPILSYSISSSVSELAALLKPYLKSVLQNTIDAAHLRSPAVGIMRSLANSAQTSRLFKAIMTAKLRAFAGEAARWSTGTLRVGPEETIELGKEILNHLSSGGFATFLVPTESYWTSGTGYFEAARQASSVYGRRITRVFIIFDESSIRSASLKDCIYKDNEAGIETLICFAHRIADHEAIRDFGIWDDELLGMVEVSNAKGSSIVTGCTYMVNREQIARAYRWRDNILASSEPAKVVLARYEREEPLHQPLVTSAGIMAKYSEQYCKGSYLDKDDCKWYHRDWQFLRLVNAVSTPDWHAQFYKQSIKESSLRISPKRILISGTADYCMLAHVSAALLESSATDYEIVVLDLCNTPLKMCEWFDGFEKLSVSIRTLQGNALRTDFRDDWFGLVISDAFLTRFDSEARKQVVAEWSRILAPEGFVITTARVEQTINRTRVAWNDRDIQTYVSKVKASAFKQAQLLPCTIEQLATMAEEFGRRKSSYPLSEQEVSELFKAYELQFEIGETPGEFKPTKYARILAKKRP